jgi:hypothetical protein
VHQYVDQPAQSSGEPHLLHLMESAAAAGAHAAGSLLGGFNASLPNTGG